MVSPIGGGGSGGVNLGSAYGEITISDNIDQALNRALGDFDNALSAIGGQMDRVGQQMSQVGQQLTLATAPLAAFGVQGVRAAADFDEALVEISARTGTVGEDLDMVAEKAKQMGADTVFSSQQVLDAFLDLTTSGASVAEAMETLDEVTDLAAAGNLELGASADLVTDAMAMFGLELEESRSVVDALAAGAASSSADVGQLGDALANVGPIAAQMGLSVEDTVAILSTFAENSIKGSEAGTQLRSMLLQMTRDVDGVQETWDQLGISLYDAEGNMNDVNDIFEELNVVMGDMPADEQNAALQTLFGSYGIVGGQILTTTAGFEGMTEKMREQASAAEVARQRMETFKNQVNSLKGSVETLMITTLTPFMNDVLRPMVIQLKEAANAITAWAEENPDLTQQIVKMLTAVTALGPVLIVLGQTLSFVGTGLAGLAPLMAALTGPIGVLIGAVTLLGIAYANNFAGIRDAINAVFDPLWEMVQSFRILRRTGSDVFEALRLGIGRFVDDLVRALGGSDSFAESVQQNFMQAVGVIEGVAGRIGDALGLIQRAFAITRGAMTHAGEGMFDAIRAGFVSLVDDIAMSLGVPQRFADLMQLMFLRIVNGVERVLPVMQQFFGLLQGAWMRVQPALMSLAGWFTQTALPTIINIVTNMAIPIVQSMFDTILQGWQLVQPYLALLAEWFMRDLQTAMNFVTKGASILDGFFNVVVLGYQLISPALEAIRDLFFDVFSFISNRVILPVINRIDDFIQKVNDALARFEVLKNGAEAWQGIGSNAQVISSGIGSGDVTAGQVGGALWNAIGSEIGGFADGINRMPTDGLIWAHADEAIIPAQNNPYNPNARQPMDIGGGGGIQIVVENVNANNAAEGRAAGNAFADTLEQRLKEKGFK